MDVLPSQPLPQRWRNATLLAAALLWAPVPALAAPAPLPAPAEVRAEIADRASSELRDFYRARDHRSLWIGPDGNVSAAAATLLDIVETADLDGINPRKLKARNLASALRKAEGNPSADNLGRAEIAASKALVALVQAMRQPQPTPMTYVSAELAPIVPTSRAVLQAAAAAPSLERYLADVGWMHPLYGQLRRLVAAGPRDPDHQEMLAANLARLRAIPASPAPRYVLVDAAGARLWMYENDRVVDSMKVVVGNADNQTPMIAGYLRNAILNPYWNVPVDLVRDRIATNVLDKGLGYLKAGRYQVLSNWTDQARVVDPAKVDWHTVAGGGQELRVRQLPGAANFMGKVKFEFPNDQGIYLHDTPDKRLMRQEERQLSSGCVRLEDAQRFGRWLLRKPLPRRVKEVERRVELPELVPVYITYLTAVPVKGQLAYNPDPYHRDSALLALGSERSRSR